MGVTGQRMRMGMRTKAGVVRPEAGAYYDFRSREVNYAH
jgi:hypothetical protein